MNRLDQINDLSTVYQSHALSVYHRETMGSIIPVQPNRNRLELLIVKVDGQADLFFLRGLFAGELVRAQSLQSLFEVINFQFLLLAGPSALLSLFLRSQGIGVPFQRNVDLTDIRKVRGKYLQMPEVVIGCGHQILPLIPASPKELVEQFVRQLEPVYQEKGIRLSYDCKEGVCLIEPDLVWSLIEHRYIRGILARTGVKQYVFSKMNSIFLAGMLNVGLGIFLYALFLRLKLPWVQAENGQYQHLLLSGGLRFFLDREWFTAYFLLWGLQYGALSGILAVLSAGLSLFTRNKLLVLATPFLSYYFIDLFLSELSQNRYSLALIFAPSNNVLGNDLLAFFVVFPISAAVLLCVGLVTERKVRKEFLNE